MITENRKSARGCKEDKKEAPLRTQDGVKQVNACIACIASCDIKHAHCKIAYLAHVTKHAYRIKVYP